ncbi:MAG: response regulator transcription factor [Ardenticatenaceae bacterium]
MNEILLVASRKAVKNSLQEVLERQDYNCLVAHNQRRALYLVRHYAPSLVILDNTSSRLRGSKFIAGLRRLADVPLIAIVRSANEAAMMNATACLVPPYTTQELINCIDRVQQKYPQELQAGSLRLDLRTRHVYVPHRQDAQQLTPKLFALLRLLMRQQGEVVSRAALMSEVWNTKFVEDTRTLDVHIHWVREMIEPNPGHPTYLRTVRGVGYRLEAVN